MSSEGRLYIVATPIGNLEDMVPRAIHTLNAVDFIAAEDTRHSGKLLKHFAVATPMLAYHEHNEEKRTSQLLELLREGNDLALISDAGTPLISDPGYRLVRACHDAGVSVVPIPGPSAMVAALSVSGLPSDQVCFVGFLPAKAGSRRRRLEALAARRDTLVAYESCHRIVDSLREMVAVLGPQRRVSFCRELTKSFETVRQLSLGELATWVEGDPDQQRGEIVLVIEGAPPAAQEIDTITENWLKALALEMSPTRAAALAARVTGLKKRVLYQWLTDLGNAGGESDT